MSDHTIPIEPSHSLLRSISVEVLAPSAARGSVKGDLVRVGSAQGNDLVISDGTVSRFHLEIRRDGGKIRVTDLGSTNGTRAGDVSFHASSVWLTPGASVSLGQAELRVSDGELLAPQSAPPSFGGLVGKSPALSRLCVRAHKVAQSEVPILLIGESGTGKEVVARAIATESPRKGQPFVTVDCAALSPTLFSSELFGHERGAFTGAERQHIGAFERAHGGTVFLDEIGELTPELQAALLGVLERGKLRRLGGQKDIDVDVRIVSATHRDLREAVNTGSFRLDLFYRIAVVLLEVPPLRERAADIPELVRHFVREAGSTAAVERLFPKDAMERLQAHRWPGNVRELRNVVLGALALGETEQVLRTGASALGLSELAEQVDELSFRDAKQRIVDAFEARYITRLLERSAGNVRQAARDARMDRSYLMELIRRHGLK
ncbi:MAG: sigma 54-interacting transcriptional regulator [Polyangiaceae bacterium]